MAEVIAREYGTQITKEPISIFTQSGDSRYENVDKMILKMVDVLPHGLVNNLEVLGDDGSALIEYIGWLKKRFLKIHPQNTYKPILHFDVYGTIGKLFNNNSQDILSYFKSWSRQHLPLKCELRDLQIWATEKIR